MIDKNSLWVEKYRPKGVEDLVLESTTKELIDKFISSKEIPHLLLSGNVGCGKTTIAKILLNLMDCDSIILNASDERGIEVVRNKIKQFAMMSSFKKWKIVFLDESDALTPDAQFSLRNLMETYSVQTRFIMTCNYLNKIIEPIRSRCQLIEFQNLGRKHIRVLLTKILEAENIKYSLDDILILIDSFYPDIRSMINHLQLYSIKSEWKLTSVDSFRNFEQLLDLLKKKEIKAIRELSLDYTEAYRYLFDKVDELMNDYEKKVKLSLIIAEYFYRSVFIPDKSINFAACCLAMMEVI